MADILAGKSVIVTGAARGIGLAIARRFVTAGAQVMLADMDEVRLEREVAAITGLEHAGRATPFYGDLRQKLTMANLAAATLDTHDGIDVLVNASRVLVPSEPLVAEKDGLEETLAQNVSATLRLSQIVARRMIELGAADETPSDRAIINLSSVQAVRTSPSLLAYSVACAAVEQLTRTLALVLAPHRIRVNAIAVGGVPGRSLGNAFPAAADLADALADVTPLGRIADSHDFADAALFLASEHASFITGQVLAVDGGRQLLDPLSARLL